MEVHEDFAHAQLVLDDAGLTLTDLSHLTPFSRSSLYNWKSGAKKPHTFYKSTLDGWIRLVEKAVDHNRLPLTEQLRGKERAVAIRKIIAEVRSL